MKKICFVVMDISEMGGAGNAMAVLANHLSETHQVHIISLHQAKSRPWTGLAPAVQIHVIQKTPFARIRYTYRQCRRTYRQLLKEQRFDYVLLQTTFVMFLGTAMGLGLGVRFIACDHGSIESQLNDRSITFLRWFAARQACRIVVLTDSSLAAYRQVFKTPAEKLVRVYNWIDPAAVDPAFSYDLKCQKIMTAGRFAPEKCFDTIIPIAAKVFARCPGWQWDVYGDGPEFDRVAEAVRTAGLESRLHLMGARPDLGRLYTQYAFYVMTSQREGLPLVLLEAKASHRPIISYDVKTGPAEIVQDGVNGFLVENQNQDMMADRIIELIENDEMRGRFASHAYDDIAKFAQGPILEQWRRLLA